MIDSTDTAIGGRTEPTITRRMSLVPRSPRLQRAALVLMLALVACTDVLAARYAMGAMACCAKAKHSCARFKSADDCCCGMGHGVGASVSVVPGATSFDPALAILPAAIPSIARPVATTATPASFKRPHDPPHLHPVPLLI